MTAPMDRSDGGCPPRAAQPPTAQPPMALGRRTLLRGSVLYGSALAAGSAVLSGCSSGDSGDSGDKDGSGKPGGSGSGRSAGGEAGGPRRAKGSHTKPLPAPKQLSEAPALAKQVQAGKLPPVDQRVPDPPYVIPHKWLTPGTYGGSLHTVTPATDDASTGEYMYGHSVLRWLNDGLDVGPGLAYSWEANDDTSEWTFHFRKGLKWSDGKSWTTADILFWWEDLVLNDDYPASVPDEMRSGKGTLAKVSAPDAVTLVMSFDAPTPLTADRVADWANGTHLNGPIWMAPKHYLARFHPAYNKSAPKDWAAADGPIVLKGDYARNPGCPTMTAWRLASYDEGKSLVWERNPYCYCVDRDGKQLPYIDDLTMTSVQDPEVAQLQVQQGKVDFAFGRFIGLELGDVSELKRTSSRSDLDIFLWDSGSGGGATIMFNQDYQDEKVRELIREPRFQQAMSHAFDRAKVRKTVYYNTGEQTTGTMSPKALEYHVKPEGPKIYRTWRDSYVAHDPAKAKKLLDEIGVIDRDGDGKRERPDGAKLVLRIDYPADAPESHVQAHQHLARDWKAIGFDVKMNPVTPDAYPVQWSAGELMTNTTWELGDGPNCLVYPNFLVPIDPGRWAPLQGQHYALRGTSQEDTEADVDPYKRTPPRMAPEPGGPVAKLWKLYDATKTEPDEMKRHRLVWQMMKVHIDQGPFMIGSVANYPHVVGAKKDLANVPRRDDLAQGGFVNPWVYPTPAVYDPECFYWKASS